MNHIERQLDLNVIGENFWNFVNRVNDNGVNILKQLENVAPIGELREDYGKLFDLAKKYRAMSVRIMAGGWQCHLCGMVMSPLQPTCLGTHNKTSQNANNMNRPITYNDEEIV